jgi:hypothetical protein
MAVHDMADANKVRPHRFLSASERKKIESLPSVISMMIRSGGKIRTYPQSFHWSTESD